MQYIFEEICKTKVEDSISRKAVQYTIYVCFIFAEEFYSSLTYIFNMLHVTSFAEVLKIFWWYSYYKILLSGFIS